MKKSRIILLAVSLLLVFALTACGTVRIEIPYDNVSGLFGGGDAVPAGSDQTAATDPTVAPIETLQPSDASTAPAESTTASTGESTTAGGGETTTAVPASTAPASSGVPSTQEEIINLYVTGYNKIASDAKSVVRTYDYTYQYNDILEINNNATLEKLAGTLMNQFMKENTEEVPGDAASLPPVGVTQLSISPSQVSKATCEDKGDYYEVTLYSTGSDDNWEIDSQAGQGSAGVIGPLLRTEDVSGAAGSFIKFEGLHTWYSTAHVTAKIDKATGHITDFDFKTPCVLHFDSVTAAVVVKVSNCNLGMEFHQIWKVTY